MLERISLYLAGMLIAGLLTVMILSYIIGDNPLFRFATHVFIGVTAGYAGAIAWHGILSPGFVEPIMARGVSALLEPSLLVPLVLVVLLLFKLFPSTARLGAIPMAMLVGIGAAVVVGGAITGTLVPQVMGAIDNLNPITIAAQTGETGLERVTNVSILLVGTVSTLLYFRFTGFRKVNGRALRTSLGKAASAIGGLFIAVAFGTMYAGVLMAAIIVLVERVQFLVDLVLSLISG
ncbi:MAG: hypothetical protein PVJ32_07360 [Anaerolineales bacterium]|jgi:hypothetical protein